MPIRNLLLPIFVSLCFLNALNAQYALTNITDKLRKDANAVVRDEVISLSVKSPKEAVYKVKRIITILNEDARAHKLVLNYSPDVKIQKINAKIIDESGEMIRSIDKDEMEDYSAVSSFSIYEDDRVKYVEINHGSYPYTIEYDYVLIFKNIMSYPNWSIQAYEVSVENASFTVELPDNMKLHYKPLNTDIKAIEKLDDKRKIYTWSVKNLPAVKRESYSYKVLPGILVSPDEFQIENYKGSMASWEKFGSFMNKLSEGRGVLSNELTIHLQQITAKAKNDREKIDILYRYLQENMRYVSVQLGIGGWQPFEAKYVEENKYGDCKALSHFMKSMLRSIGIKSNPILIYAGSKNFEITDDFTTNAFNHMILYVPSESYWLECTSTYNPPNYLGYSNSDRNVLMVTAQGGEVIRTPLMDEQINYETINASLTLSPDGSAILSGHTMLSGLYQDTERYTSKTLSKEKYEERFKKKSDLPTFEIHKLEVNVDSEQPIVTQQYELAMNRYGSKSGKRMFVPLNKISSKESLHKINIDRKNPIIFKTAYQESLDFTLEIPEGYTVESMPDKVLEIETVLGSYKLQCTHEANTIHVKRHIIIKAVEIPASEHAMVHDFYKTINKADKSMLVLVAQK